MHRRTGQSRLTTASQPTRGGWSCGRSGSSVDKLLCFPHFYIRNIRRSFYQDRLGTNTGTSHFKWEYRVLAVRRVDTGKGDALQKVRGRKTSFWSHFDTKNLIVLPRQARDKHRETTQQKAVFAAAHRQVEAREQRFQPDRYENGPLFLSTFHAKNDQFYQDRLGTNTGPAHS
jgi:hypothetical protein